METGLGCRVQSRFRLPINYCRMNSWDASTIATSLHDAVVDQFRFDAVRGRLEIIIWKRPEDSSLLYWRLMVSGIRSSTCELQHTQAAIDTVLKSGKRKSLGFRVDEFQCKKQLGLDNGSAFTVSLSIDHLTPLRIDCLKCTIQPVL